MTVLYCKLCEFSYGVMVQLCEFSYGITVQLCEFSYGVMVQGDEYSPQNSKESVIKTLDQTKCGQGRGGGRKGWVIDKIDK